MNKGLGLGLGVKDCAIWTNASLLNCALNFNECWPQKQDSKVCQLLCSPVHPISPDFNLKRYMFIRFSPTLTQSPLLTNNLLSIIYVIRWGKTRKPERTDPLQGQQVWNLLPSFLPVILCKSILLLLIRLWPEWYGIIWSVFKLNPQWKKKKSEKVIGTVWELEILRPRTICEKYNS